jgi:hypothetical protein
MALSFNSPTKKEAKGGKRGPVYSLPFNSPTKKESTLRTLPVGKRGKNETTRIVDSWVKKRRV